MSSSLTLNELYVVWLKNCACFIIPMIIIACSDSPTVTNKVKIHDGRIEGSQEESGVISFKGIPYAAPPIGKFRWKEPQPVQPWSDSKKCTAFSASPMQADPQPFYMWSSEFLIPSEPIDEDCLYLNVWTNAKKVTDKRPVLVWIYGGGFSSGSGSVPIYDGEQMAKQDVIFVSFNYRVGIFGFFSHPELSAESPTKSSGNYGLMDQIAALKWVKKNISAFGGDPDNVTIAGQSAGSVSVVSLIASPMASGLFTKAIAQSGAGLLRMTLNSTDFTFGSLKQAEAEGLAAAGDSLSIKQLRNLSAKQLMTSIKFRTQPIVDGNLLPGTLGSIFKAKNENQVALMTGWTEGEGIVIGKPRTALEFKQFIKDNYGENEKSLLECYPADTDGDALKSEFNLSRDVTFGAQNFALANIVSRHGQSVFVYHFTKEVPGEGEYAKFGAFHTGEVPYALGDLKFSDRPWQPEDHNLAKIMSAYWANFVKSGNPNASGLPDWPAYNTNTKLVMDFGKITKAKTVPDSTCLNLLSTLLSSE